MAQAMIRGGKQAEASAEDFTKDFVQNLVGDLTRLNNAGSPEETRSILEDLQRTFLVRTDGDIMSRLEELDRRLNDPALLEELRPYLLDIYITLGFAVTMMRNGDRSQGLQDYAADLHTRISQLLSPESTTEIPSGGAAYTAAPSVEEIPQIPPTQYIRPESKFLDADIQIPIQLARSFATQAGAVSDLWSYGIVLNSVENGQMPDADREQLDAILRGLGIPTTARECGQALVEMFRANIASHTGSSLSLADFLSGNWTDLQTQEILSMFGFTAGGTYALPDGTTVSSEELARQIINAFNEGRFNDALGMAPEGSALDRVNETIAQETANNRVSFHIPEYGAEASLEMQRIPLYQGTGTARCVWIAPGYSPRWRWTGTTGSTRR